MRGRVLLVEDIEDTREQLKALIEEEITGCVVTTASDVLSGIDAIDRAVEAGIVFDAGVLDVKLPETAGEHPSSDEKVCGAFRVRMPKGLVFDKGAGFPADLIDTLRRYLYNHKIAEAIENLFVPQANIPMPPARSYS